MIRKALARPLVWTLFILTLAIAAAPFAVANPFMPIGSSSNEPLPPTISIQSATESEAYSTASDTLLNFTANAPITEWYCPKSLGSIERHALTFGQITQARFSVDGNAEKNADLIDTVYAPNYSDRLTKPHEYLFCANLGRLSSGTHVVTVKVDGWGYYGNSTHGAFSDTFIVDADETDKMGNVTSSTQLSFVVSGAQNDSRQNREALSNLSTVVSVIALIIAITAASLIVYNKKIKRANKAH